MTYFMGQPCSGRMNFLLRKRMLLVTFADPKASRVLWPHFGAEDGVGKPKGLQRGGDPAHAGRRGGKK